MLWVAPAIGGTPMAQEVKTFSPVKAMDKKKRGVKARWAGLQKARESFRTQWRQSSLGAMDFDFLVNNISPDVMMRARKDPQFWQVIMEVGQNPSTATIAK
ncbi:uncharacterized protein HaLaN_00713, partial [Haematococcus lacustris]